MSESHRDGQSKKADTPNPVAGYIATMADELAQLAKSNGLDPLAFILNMASLEADQVSKTANR